MNRYLNHTHMYEAYIENITLRIDRAKVRLVQCLDQLDYIYRVIAPYKRNFLLLDINIDTIRDTSAIYTARVSESKLKNGELRVVTIDEGLLKNYLVSFSKCKIKILYLKDYIQKLEKGYMSQDIYSSVLKTFNFELSKRLLNGYIYTLGFNLGKLFIKRIRRVFSINGKEATKKIDWGESNKRRAKITEEGGTPYDKELAPHGEKWFVYHTDDYLYWYWWEKFSSRVPNAFLYTFTPTSYVNTAERSQIQFVEQCKSKDDILNTNLLGSKDKLYCLMRFDSTHGNNYVTNERETINK